MDLEEHGDLQVGKKPEKGPCRGLNKWNRLWR